jgi:glycosyltransferase involved in cell wall biosynthesis
MCEALAALGHSVTLMHPWRRQVDPAQKSTPIQEYYGVESSFRIVTLFNLDHLVIQKWMPKLVFRGLSVIASFFYEIRLARKAKSEKPDLIYSRDATPFAAYRVANSGARTILEFHSLPSGITRFFLKRAVNQSNTISIMAVTASLAKELEGLLQIEHVGVLHDGVRLKDFIPEATEIMEPSNSNSQTQPTIMYTGSFGRGKGVDTFIGAARKMPDSKFVVVGGSPNDPDFFGGYKTDAPRNVEFAGYVSPPGVPAQLSKADVLILPISGRDMQSSHRTSPMKLFEYMAAGKPIVAARVSAIREVLEDGKTGLFFEPDSADSLVETLTRLLSDPELGRQLGLAAAGEAHNYGWEQRAGKVVETVERLG